MATFNKFNSFVEALAEKKHNLGSDQIVVALTNVAPNATDTQLSDITEIAYTNLSSRDVTTNSSSQTSGTYKLVLEDLTLSATGSVEAFRYIVLYNDDATNDELIGYYDYGASVSLNNGETMALDFNDTNGVLQIV